MLPDRLTRQRVAAQHQGLEHLLDDGLVGERHRAGAKALPPAGHTLVGLDFDQMRRARGVVLL